MDTYEKARKREKARDGVIGWAKQIILWCEPENGTAKHATWTELKCALTSLDDLEAK